MTVYELLTDTRNNRDYFDAFLYYQWWKINTDDCMFEKPLFMLCAAVDELSEFKDYWKQKIDSILDEYNEENIVNHPDKIIEVLSYFIRNPLNICNHDNFLDVYYIDKNELIATGGDKDKLASLTRYNLANLDWKDILGLQLPQKLLLYYDQCLPVYLSAIFEGVENEVVPKNALTIETPDKYISMDRGLTEYLRDIDDPDIYLYYKALKQFNTRYLKKHGWDVDTIPLNQEIAGEELITDYLYYTDFEEFKKHHPWFQHRENKDSRYFDWIEEITD